MSDDDVRDRVIAGFLLVLPDLAPEQVTALTTADDAWDSLASVVLLATIEEEFAVTFADDEVAAMTSFDAVVDAVERATRAAG